MWLGDKDDDRDGEDKGVADIGTGLDDSLGEFNTDIIGSFGKKTGVFFIKTYFRPCINCLYYL